MMPLVVVEGGATEVRGLIIKRRKEHPRHRPGCGGASEWGGGYCT